MLKSPRNNSHATSACVQCRRRKTRCDVGKPSCASCVKKSEECEYTVDSDRRTARGRKCETCPALQAMVAERDEEIARLRALLLEFATRVNTPHMDPEALQMAVYPRSAESCLPSARPGDEEQVVVLRKSEFFKLFLPYDAATADPPCAAPGPASNTPGWIQHVATPQCPSGMIHPDLDDCTSCAMPPFQFMSMDAELESHWAACDSHT